MNPEHEVEQAQPQLSVQNADLVSTSQTIESAVSLSDVVQAVEQAQGSVTPGPAAIEEQEQEQEDLSGLEKVLSSFAGIPEGNFFSNEVNQAIDIIVNSESMQQVVQLMSQNDGMSFRNLLFRRVDAESQNLDNFMHRLQGIPSSPSLDVDFI